MNCPICGRWCPAGSPRCTACGADFRDPDVMKVAAAPVQPVKAAAGVGIASLANDRFLGLSGAGLADGTSLRWLAGIGALLLATGALVSFDGPTRAIVVPLVLAAAGLAVALPPPGRIPSVAIAGLLAAGGLVELGLGLTPLGETAWTATDLPVLLWLGVLTGGVGVAYRIVRPSDPTGARVALAGTVLFVIGGLLPFGDVGAQLPFEFGALARRGPELDGSILGLGWDALGSGTLLFALGAITLLPVLALPLATLLAFRRPTGVWDGAGNALRALGVVIALWIPLSYAIAAFNLFGWGDLDLPYRGRIQLAALAGGAALWATAGAVALLFTARSTRTG